MEGERRKRVLTPEERRIRRRKRKQKQIIAIAILLVVAILVISLAVFIISSLVKFVGGLFFGEKPPKEDPNVVTAEQVIAEADLLAAMYDYDAAIKKISDFNPEYTLDETLKASVDKYTAEKSKLVPWTNIYEITHVFFHTMIKDNAKAFDGDYKEAGYNQYMTTISEFNKMMEEMYKRGFVLVKMHDIAEMKTDESGNKKMTPKTIYLPEGKKPFVMSQDDVSYYAYMTEDGFASRIIIDEQGNPTCEYINDDGSVTRGSFDLVPLLEDFLKVHPDFSYRGARACLAITGYDGVLGYRTCPSGDGYNPEDIEKAKVVADRIKELGYEFASHSWGHRNYGDISYEDLVTDSNKWEKEVQPILGETDILIYAHGNDIAGIEKYDSDNAKFEHLKTLGFDYFCNVDSNEYWVQLSDRYLRQGRRNLDGYRMYHSPSLLDDLFEVSDVWDSDRPTPVPDI